MNEKIVEPFKKFVLNEDMFYEVVCNKKIIIEVSMKKCKLLLTGFICNYKRIL